VYLHALCKVLGPTLSAFTTLPHSIAVSREGLDPYLCRIHERYSDVVRIAPDESSFVNPDALRDIYSHGTKCTQGRVPSKAFSRHNDARKSNKL
jgi:hypothetical protein